MGAAYSYLLGQYLGDGHLVTKARVPRAADLRLRRRTRAIVAEIGRRDPRRSAAGRQARVAATGDTDCVTVQSYWMHWPCLFPQHGPGPKHKRPIELAPWQRDLVSAQPWPFVRGMIHSDGCRATNRVVAHGKAVRLPALLLLQRVHRHPRDHGLGTRPGRRRVALQPAQQHLDRAPRLGRADGRAHRPEGLTSRGLRSARDGSLTAHDPRRVPPVRPPGHRLDRRLLRAARVLPGAVAGRARARSAPRCRTPRPSTASRSRRAARPRRHRAARHHALAAPVVLRLLPGQRQRPGDPRRPARVRARRAGHAVGHLAGRDRTRDARARLVRRSCSACPSGSCPPARAAASSSTPPPTPRWSHCSPRCTG